MACDSKSQDAGPLVTGLLTLLPLVVGISGQVRTGVRNGPFDDTTTASTLTACCFPRSVSMSDCRASGRARRRKGGSRLPADLSERGVRCWALRVRQTDHPTVVRGIPPVAAATARSRRTKRETSPKIRRITSETPSHWGVLYDLGSWNHYRRQTGCRRWWAPPNRHEQKLPWPSREGEKSPKRLQGLCAARGRFSHE